MSKKFNIDKIKRNIENKFPLIENQIRKVKMIENYQISTAMTDGFNIYYNPDFLASHSEEEQTFIITHEFFHKMFNHIKRSENKEIDIWNISCDAVINQIIQDAGIPIPRECINLPEARNKSAEEMYEELIKQRDKIFNNQNNQEQSNNKTNQGNAQHIDNNISENAINSKFKDIIENIQNKNKQQQNSLQQSQNQPIDMSQFQFNNDGLTGQHNDWQRILQEMKKTDNENSNQNSSDKSNKDNENNGDKFLDQFRKNRKKYKGQPVENDEYDEYKNAQDELMDFFHTRETETINSEFRELDETSERESEKDLIDIENFERNFSKNNERKHGDILQDVINQLTEIKNNSGNHGSGFSNGSPLIENIVEIREDKKATDWRKILRAKCASKYEYQSSFRRADKYNDYSSRITRLQTFEKPLTEVMLDTSCSVSTDLLKCFLRQLKTILPETELYVGCFDDSFYGLSKITSIKDIESFKIIGRGGTDFNVAIKHFSPGSRRKINRIIFSDGGYPQNLIKEDSKKLNIIYIIFDNNYFETNLGQVIHVTSKNINNPESEDEEFPSYLLIEIR